MSDSVAISVSVAKKRNRQSNFSPSDLSLIADEVSSRQRILFGPFTSTVTSSAKQKEWDEIATKLNACSSIQRSGSQIRKKWNDYKSQVKKRAIDIRRDSSRTGGGPAPTGLSDLEHKIVSLIPTCQIEGIVGGLESEVDEACLTLEAVPSPTIEDTFGTEILAEQVTVEQPESSPDPQPSTSTSTATSTSTPVSSEHLENQRPHLTENEKTMKKAIVKRKQRLPATENPPGMSKLISAEEDKSAVLKELLGVQRQILAVSEQRLKIESDRLALERERFEFKKQILNITENKSISPVIQFLHEF